MGLAISIRHICSTSHTQLARLEGYYNEWLVVEEKNLSAVGSGLGVTFEVNTPSHLTHHIFIYFIFIFLFRRYYIIYFNSRYMY